MLGPHSSAHLGVREEDTVHGEAGAVADHHRRLLDLAAKLQRVQHHLRRIWTVKFCRQLHSRASGCGCVRGLTGALCVQASRMSSPQPRALACTPTCCPVLVRFSCLLQNQLLLYSVCICEPVDEDIRAALKRPVAKNGQSAYLLGGLSGAHDLQQWHHVRGREEVGADDAIGGARVLANQADVDGAGVAAQDGVRAARLLQVGKDALLQGDVLPIVSCCSEFGIDCTSHMQNRQ